MRVLIATIYRNVAGGVETYLRDLIPALRSRGHEVALLHEVPADRSRPTVDGDGPAWCGDLRAVPQWRPDVVYAQGLIDPGLEEALVASYPTVLFAHNYHGTCLSGTKRQAFPASTPCERTFGPACAALYLPCRCGGLNPLTVLSRYPATMRRGGLLRRYRAVLVASRHMREEYRRHDVAEDRLHLTPLFPTAVEPDEELSYAAMTDEVLFAGRLTELKGGALLVPAVAAASERLGRRLRLVVAGDGPERRKLERLAERHRVEAEFHGWVNPAQRVALMRRAAVLAFPSVWPEPFGLVGIEAGCVGLPAVGYAVGGVTDWLIPGESGELAPADPPTSLGLREALVGALSDPAHHARLRAGALGVARRFTRERHVDALLGHLRAVALQPETLPCAGT